MKVVTILGARPQFIKAAALSRVINSKGSIQEIIVHTGQHYDDNMSRVFFEQMQIPPPAYNLNVKSALHGEMTGQMLTGIEKILLQEQPGMVLVYGDTNSTLAGALAAAKLHIPVAHVEAGLRSFNMTMPEEVNRILTDRMSKILFCPAQNAIQNLRTEGFDNFDCEIHEVGDIMKDTAYFYKALCQKPAFPVPDQFMLATIHRAESTDNENNLLTLVDAFNELAETTPIILPLHPRTKKKINDLKITFSKNVFICEPLGYLEMVYLLMHCELVVTDSGGLQKEAYYFNKYCITVRNETEWTELVDAGYNFVTSLSKTKILGALKSIRASTTKFDTAIYGSGNTAAQIETIVSRFLGKLK